MRPRGAGGADGAAEHVGACASRRANAKAGDLLDRMRVPQAAPRMWTWWCRLEDAAATAALLEAKVRNCARMTLDEPNRDQFPQPAMTNNASRQRNQHQDAPDRAIASRNSGISPKTSAMAVVGWAGPA